MPLKLIAAAKDSWACSTGNCTGRYSARRLSYNDEGVQKNVNYVSFMEDAGEHYIQNAAGHSFREGGVCFQDAGNDCFQEEDALSHYDDTSFCQDPEYVPRFHSTTYMPTTTRLGL